jgi:hypothetical protein
MAGKIMKTLLKILIYILGIALLLVILAWGALNIAKFFIYSDYYSIKSNVCENPGLSDGFVCQGICAYEDEQLIFVSGYMADDSPSRIYVTDTESNFYYVSLTAEGEPFTGHAGGISVWQDRVYVASGKKLYTLDAKKLSSASNGESVEMTVAASVNNSASFCFADDDYVYVGEFHDGGKYVTDHPYETDEGMHYAIVTLYSHSDLQTPIRIYSIRNKVQGFCVTDMGRIILSTSYGLTSSVYYVYNAEDAIDSGLTLDGAPVYYLSDCVREMTGPAMAEGLDVFNSEVITLTESASNKYIFGKFFFASKIVSLDFEQE